MAHPVTEKKMQRHEECVCGFNTVDSDSLRIRYKDFKAAGIKRKIDKSTGKPFLLMVVKFDVCGCYD